MKILTLLTLIIAVGCILATGCVVAQPKKDPGNATATPTNTFTPLVNTTTVPSSNPTLNATNATSKLKGPLRVSISSYVANLSVMLDDQTVGYVSSAKPLDMMVYEGNHSVKVCVGAICEVEYVKILFAKQTFVDFGERLRKRVEFSEPTVRIIDFYRNGDGVRVVVEFINPTEKHLSMSAEVSIGYSFISGRTGQREGESVRGQAYSDVEAGRRNSENIDLYFDDGIAYMFDPPNLGKIKVR